MIGKSCQLCFTSIITMMYHDSVFFRMPETSYSESRKRVRCKLELPDPVLLDSEVSSTQQEFCSNFNNNDLPCFIEDTETWSGGEKTGTKDNSSLTKPKEESKTDMSLEPKVKSVRLSEDFDSDVLISLDNCNWLPVNSLKESNSVKYTQDRDVKKNTKSQGRENRQDLSWTTSTLERNSSVNWKRYGCGGYSFSAQAQPSMVQDMKDPSLSSQTTPVSVRGLTYPSYQLPPHLKPFQHHVTLDLTSESWSVDRAESKKTNKKKQTGYQIQRTANYILHLNGNGDKHSGMEEVEQVNKSFIKSENVQSLIPSEVDPSPDFSNFGSDFFPAGASLVGDSFDRSSFTESETIRSTSQGYKRVLEQTGVDIQRILAEMSRERNTLPVFELHDKLKNLKPYVISGWISTTYLKALMQKPDLINEMFDNALDMVGDIRPDIIESCRKNTPAVLAKELVFRVFTLGELNNGLRLQRLSRNKLGAIRRCVKKQFPKAEKLVWSNKCVPQIKRSLKTLFEHRVKRVQEFWLNEADELVKTW